MKIISSRTCLALALIGVPSAEFVATPKYATTRKISDAAFKITSKSGDITWTYAVTKGILSHGNQSVAEACAWHLRDIVK